MEPHTSLLMKLSKSLKCSICFEIFTDPATSSCGQHNYCLQCLKAQYEGRAKSCPACREEFHKDYRPQKNITLCDIVGVVPRSTWDDMLTFSEHEDLQSSVEGTEAADGAEENLQTLKRKLTLLITEIERLDEILSKKCKLKQEYQDTAWGESNEHVNQSASYHLTGSEDGSLHGLSELPDLRLDSVTGSLRLGLECLTHALSELEQLDAPSQNGDAELIEREGLQGDSHPATAAVAWQQQNAERSLERPVSPFPPEGDQSESQSWSQGGSMELEAGGAEAGPAAVDDWLEHLTFSSQLAHKYLSFSGDNRRVQVRRRNLGRPSPSRRDRFGLSQVMTDQVFSSGVHYWEVDTSGSVGWAIGVAYDDLGRDDKLGRTSSSWCLEWSSNKLCFWHDNSSEQIKYGCPARVRIMLDMDGGVLTFYNPADNMIVLHTVEVRFISPVRPAFWLYGLKPGNSLALITPWGRGF
ncbi:hypothetical protein GJAV_G00144860 [Gymnothorax javanicus]|nr:hypothetical protein GJAV_G00144860 [Gymnothorax javanicus]